MRPRDLLLDVRPLRVRDVRVLMAARTVSMLDGGLVAVAVSVQVYALTRSSLQVGLVGLTMALAVLVSTLAGGVLADRVDRRLLLLGCGATGTVSLLLLTANAALDSPQLWVIYVCAVVAGAADGLDETAQFVVVPALVPAALLPAAGAMASIVINLGNLLGPVIGGAVVALGGAGWAYAAAAATTGVATLVLLRLSACPPSVREPAPGSADGTDAATSPVAELAEGLRYAVRDKVIAGVLVVDACAVLLAAPFVLLPEFAERALHAGPEAVGVLFAAPAAGALLGSVLSGWTSRLRRPGPVLLAAVAAWGGSVAGFGLAGSLVVAVLFLAAGGAADAISEILRRSLIQARSPEHLAGRIGSVWLAQAMVAPSIGGVGTGVLARWAGPRAAAVVGGTACAAMAVVLSLALPALRDAPMADDEDDQDAVAAEEVAAL